MLVLLTSGAVLLLLDQWSKKKVQSLAPELSLGCIPLLEIRRVVNLNRFYRLAWVRFVFVVTWCVAFISAALLYRSGMWFCRGVSQIGVGMALGGAAGNLVDILRHHSIVDFIGIRWWPQFNFADVGIVVGLLLAFSR